MTANTYKKKEIEFLPAWPVIKQTYCDKKLRIPPQTELAPGMRWMDILEGVKAHFKCRRSYGEHDPARREDVLILGKFGEPMQSQLLDAMVAEGWLEWLPSSEKRPGTNMWFSAKELVDSAEVKACTTREVRKRLHFTPRPHRKKPNAKRQKVVAPESYLVQPQINTTDPRLAPYVEKYGVDKLLHLVGMGLAQV